MSMHKQDDTDVFEIFKDYEDADQGGQHGILGFSYQVWWAVQEALVRHATEDDYAVVLEWLQDVAILDSSVNPSKVHFIQLKKNESTLNWTLASLIKAEGEDDNTIATTTVPILLPQQSENTQKINKKVKVKKTKIPKKSILSKLYHHRDRFKSCSDIKLSFISNAPFTYKNDDNGTSKSKDEVVLSSLSIIQKGEIENAIRKQLELSDESVINLDDFLLCKSVLPVHETHVFVTGVLASMIEENKFKYEIVSPLKTVLIIAQYVFNKAGKIRFAKDFNGLLERAITRANVNEYIMMANGSSTNTKKDIESVVARLNSEVAPFYMIEDMRTELNKVCIEVTNRNSPIWGLIKNVKSVYDVNMLSFRKLRTLTEVFEEWLSKLKELSNFESGIYSEGCVYCLMAMVIKNADPIRQLQHIKISSEPEEAK